MLSTSDMNYWRENLVINNVKLNLIVLLLGFAFTPTQAAQLAKSVTLAWQASSDPSVTGNRVHYGTVPGVYTTSVDVGNATTATLTGLTPGIIYYYVVTNYNSNGLSSVPSNEVSGMAQGYPSVSLGTPGGRASFNGPTVVGLSATASEIGGSIARVQFYSGNVLFAETTSAPFTSQWSAAPGSYILSAVAYDASGMSVQSSLQAVTVVQPAISSMQRMMDGSCELTVTGAPGGSNRVDVTNDLVNWTLLTTVVNSSGTAVFLDPEAATATRRFYRMISN